MTRALQRTRGASRTTLTCVGAAAKVELDSIQDYVAESDNLVALQQQIRDCDGILGKMESLLGGFQSDLGKISSEVHICSATTLGPGGTACLRAQVWTRAAARADQVAARAVFHHEH